MNRVTQYLTDWPVVAASSETPAIPPTDGVPDLRTRFAGAHSDMIVPSGRTYIDEQVRAEGLGRTASGEIMFASVTLSRYREPADTLDYVALDLGKSDLFNLEGNCITIHGPGALAALASALVTLQNDPKAREMLNSTKPPIPETSVDDAEDAANTKDDRRPEDMGDRGYDAGDRWKRGTMYDLGGRSGQEIDSSHMQPWRPEPRGVYFAPFKRDGRRVLYAVTAAGNIAAERTIEDGFNPLFTIDELWELLDRVDPDA